MNCPRCKEHAIFYEQRRIPLYEGFSEAAIGLLSCPVCGHEELTIHEVFQVRPEPVKSNQRG